MKLRKKIQRALNCLPETLHHMWINSCCLQIHMTKKPLYFTEINNLHQQMCSKTIKKSMDCGMLRYTGLIDSI